MVFQSYHLLVDFVRSLRLPLYKFGPNSADQRRSPIPIRKLRSGPKLR